MARELTQKDVTEAWRLLSISTGKEALAKTAASDFQSAKSGIDSEYKTAEGRAQTNYDKAVSAAQTKRATSLSDAQVLLTSADDTASDAREKLAAFQDKLKEETGQEAQLPVATGGGSTRV